MWDFLVTFGLFNAALCALPLLGLSFVVLRILQKLWILTISAIFEDVEFLRTTTVRSLLDTHRNQGIISILLSVRGQAQPEAVRRHLQEVVNRRDKSGNYTFPRLRHCLVSKCGTYGWKRATFDLDQNWTVAPVNYKGRPVTEFNIQDYVCEIVSKYLPQNIPPWQLTIIPSSEDQHYILVKLHHLLLNEGLNVGDLLPLIPPAKQIAGGFRLKSPLLEGVEKPTAMLKLKERLAEDLSNYWNEFVSNYDPLECTDLLKNNPGMFQFQAILLVTLVSTLKEFRKNYGIIKDDLWSRLKYYFLTLEREARKRRINFEIFAKSIWVTLDPRNVLRAMISGSIRSLLIPWRIIQRLGREFGALYVCVLQGYCTAPQTIVGTFYDYTPLVYNALKELSGYFLILYQGPRTILGDILMKEESFQTITLCGRKSVAWSSPVKMDLIKSIAKSCNVSETEIMLSAISSSISKYFVQSKQDIPEDVPVTLRNINSNYIFACGPKVKPQDSVSGILCMNLSIPNPEIQVSPLENLLNIKSNLKTSLEKQKLSYVLSLLQTKYGILTEVLPSSAFGVYLRYLSRKYSIAIAEISNRHPNITQRTLWGQEVTSVIYFRPPQANASVSLCLNEYADHVKLGAMVDSQLVPHHLAFVNGFPEYIQILARAAGIQQ